MYAVMRGMKRVILYSKTLAHIEYILSTLFARRRNTPEYMMKNVSDYSSNAI